MTRELVLLTLALGACRSEPAPAPATAPAPASSAQQQLDQLDQRRPLPLLPMMAHHQKQNMRDHLLAVQQIVVGATQRDFSAVEAAAKRIGYSDSMGAMCHHLGSGAPGFADAAVAFHRAADEIGQAARRQDEVATLSALGRVLEHCTSCHAAYKQTIVDEAAWQALTSR